jgi:hypothetical protein
MHSIEYLATKRGNVSTQSWKGKSAVFLMESALMSDGSSKSNKKPSDGFNLITDLKLMIELTSK